MIQVQLASAFVAAAQEVLKAEIGGEIERGDLRIIQSHYTSQDVTVMIGVTGEIEGMVLFGTSELTAVRMASAILGHTVPVFNEIAESAFAEIGNIISGHATVEFEKMGVKCNISPPTVLIGHGTIISSLSIQRMLIPFTTKFGVIEISVALR